MKKLSKLFVIAFVLGLSLNASAQIVGNESPSLENKLNPIQIFSNKIVYVDEEQSVTYSDSVSVDAGKFKASGADKIIYDIKSKKLIVFGVKDFSIDGELIVLTDLPRENVIEYSVGSETATWR